MLSIFEWNYFLSVLKIRVIAVFRVIRVIAQQKYPEDLKKKLGWAGSVLLKVKKVLL